MVGLTATVTTDDRGAIDYTFYCDRSDSGTDITPGWATGTMSQETVVETESCIYSVPGTYSPKVIVRQGTALPDEERALLIVAESTRMFTEITGSHEALDALSQRAGAAVRR